MPVKKAKSIKSNTLRKPLAKKSGSTKNANSKNSDKDNRPYEERTRGQLYEVARKLEIDGRSKMDKDQLIRAIRKIK